MEEVEVRYIYVDSQQRRRDSTSSYVHTASKGFRGRICHAVWVSLTMAHKRAQRFCSLCHMRDLMGILKNLAEVAEGPESKVKQRHGGARRIGGTNVVVPWASHSCPAQMSTHPKMDNGPERCHRKRQLMIGLCVTFVRPCKSLQLGAKSTTRRNVQPLPDMSRASMALRK